MNKRFLQKDTLALGVYSALSVLLMTVSILAPEPLYYARLAVTQTFAPVLDLAKKPALMVDDMLAYTGQYIGAVEQNKALKNQLVNITQLQHQIALLKDENTRLHKLLDISEKQKAEPLAAKVISDAKSPFARSLLVHVGKNKGVQAGQEVLHHGGLVGRVVDVFPTTARILLVSDYSFRLPVKMMEINVRGLARGTNGDDLELMLVESDVKIAEGTKVVTSGAAGLMLPDIPLGVLKYKKGAMRIVPFASPSMLDYVTILRRDVKGVLADDSTD